MSSEIDCGEKREFSSVRKGCTVKQTRVKKTALKILHLSVFNYFKIILTRLLFVLAL